MSKTISLALAKTQLAECVREAEQGQSIIITRHGKPVAALVATEDLEHLERLRKAGPEAGLAGLAGGWEGSDELVDLIREVKRSDERRPIRLD